MRSSLLRLPVFCVVLAAAMACNKPAASTTDAYNQSPETGVRTGGVRMIPVKTPSGTFNVWTKRVGNNPKIKVLLLHGGPGANHTPFECFESYLPAEGIEFYYYDQLGSMNSDHPTDSTLWETPRFVEEVEQVRQALGLNKDNFYLLGHSWGGILATEYALKHQQNLKGLIISNMMSSCPDYGKYADEVLAKQMDPKVLAEIRAIEARKDFNNPRYTELLMGNFYNEHFCRLKPWPNALDRAFPALNATIYTLMQGPSEFGISGRLANWDRRADLPKITVPTLTIGGNHDTMDPKHMAWMATQVQNGSSLICPDGSHCSMWDDQSHYFPGLIKFIKGVDAGQTKSIL
ncbi:proline iminopeptidase-family hydrolase [Fibrella aquatilis]|uniref:Proline iminopeptidase-family hydrolase n=1 Tax=Fibrella aquatilis TaxID=2817059 RepID=A0A939JZF4_9BACT|nr:proline iminopeptidase-family hydrolase [Fibrella aquatilis]MBO0930881.1 proline iminopeptidase-family hydrolase [Fibrella aquatilis]